MPLAAVSPDQTQLISNFGSSSDVQTGTSQQPAPFLFAPVARADISFLHEDVWGQLNANRERKGKGVVLGNLYNCDQEGVQIKQNGTGR